MLRSISEGEIPEFLQAVHLGFGLRAPSDLANDTRAFEGTIDLDRTYALVRKGSFVGTGASRTFSISVPGELPMGGLTMVTVVPTHQRQGHLSSIVNAHLDDARHRGEAASVLWSSESALYRRFGYGVASVQVSMAFDSRIVRLPQPDSASRLQIEAIDADRALAALPGIYDSVLSERPGMATRSPDWWRFRVLTDDASSPGGWSERRYALASPEHGQPAYVIYRQKPGWDGILNEGQVEVLELVGGDPDALLTLNGFIFRLSLFPNVRYTNVASDDPLPFQVTDSRRLNRRLRDALHLRPLDVPQLLTQRRYLVSQTTILEIHDGLGLANGTYRLDTTADGASCTRTQAEPDVTMDVATLGSLYLGGVAAYQLMNAGLITGTPESVVALGMAMSWPMDPWSAEAF